MKQLKERIMGTVSHNSKLFEYWHNYNNEPWQQVKTQMIYVNFPGAFRYGAAFMVIREQLQEDDPSWTDPA